jgi:CTP synthase
MVWDLGEHNAIVIHLTLVPYLACWRIKNKLHSIQTLMESGIKADILVAGQSMKFQMKFVIN